MEPFPKKDAATQDRPPVDRDPPGPPLQFGPRALLIVQTAAAAVLAVSVMFGEWGILAVFFATLLVMAKKVSPPHELHKQLIVDFLGGVLLSVLCLVYDPFLFRDGAGPQVVALLAIGLQILLLIVWRIVSLGPTPWASFFAGALTVGLIMAMTIGSILLPFGLVGMVLGPQVNLVGMTRCLVGTLGFTPFLTASVFYRNARAAKKRAVDCQETFRRKFGYLLGVTFAVGLPLAAWLLVGDELAQLLRALPRPARWWDV